MKPDSFMNLTGVLDPQIEKSANQIGQAFVVWAQKSGISPDHAYTDLFAHLFGNEITWNDVRAIATVVVAARRSSSFLNTLKEHVYD